MNSPTLHPANNETQCNCYITLREMFKLLSCETEFSEMCQNLIPLLILVLQYIFMHVLQVLECTMK